MISGAGHYTTFIGFARKYGGNVNVDERWQQFLDPKRRSFRITARKRRCTAEAR